MGDPGQNMAAWHSAKTATVSRFSRIGIITAQKITAVFGNGRYALDHLVVWLVGMLGQHNVTNPWIGVAISGRIQQHRGAIGESRFHGTAVHPAALPAWPKQPGVAKNRGNWQWLVVHP